MLQTINIRHTYMDLYTLNLSKRSIERLHMAGLVNVQNAWIAFDGREFHLTEAAGSHGCRGCHDAYEMVPQVVS